ncbi:MAG: ferrous iron transporter B [Clostridiales bacterium]|nr:ferrous iron transporter B [Clostridiales bacterium]
MKEITAALAGNPNVGKSTVFNALTGLHQHTGNWPGKTVASAEGGFRVGDTAVRLVDLPGTYSLSADSPEEEIARDYLLSGAADVTVAVADATCLARNLSLVLQIRQITPRLVLCVNLLDEAEKEGVETDLSALSQRLSCPVIGTAARVRRAEAVAAACQRWRKPPHRLDRRLDRLFTGRLVGIPAMLLLLGAVFYLTIWGAAAPSAFLQKTLFSLLEPLGRGLSALGAPEWLRGLLCDGVYRTTAWVVAVMLPPMAIFFPLFTLLEDAGYLPRVAFNLDGLFCRCGGHGRQSLTMCMGFGCNACGVTGCRIIDSPRERLTAQLTNSLVPCNGRFPTLVTLLTLFFLGNTAGPLRRLLGAGLFLAIIVFSVLVTLLSSKLLSRTLLRGEVSSFSLELPPYRLPQVGRVLVRSLLDRTLFVLGRAVTVAVPAGALIWVLAHLTVSGWPLLTVLADLLQPLGDLMGLDGMVLLAFLLAFPANEIMLPILAMGYLSTSVMAEVDTLRLGAVLLSHGWSWQTAVCAAVLCLFHLPCGTTCLTLLRETGSKKWTLVGMLLPLFWGLFTCCLLHGLFCIVS